MTLSPLSSLDLPLQEVLSACVLSLPVRWPPSKCVEETGKETAHPAVVMLPTKADVDRAEALLEGMCGRGM